MDYVHGYCRDISSFQQVRHHIWFKTSRGGEYPIYDIVGMCMPNSPFFSAPRYMINPPFLKKKVYDCPDFWNWNGPNFLTPMYMHIYYPESPPYPPPPPEFETCHFMSLQIVCNYIICYKLSFLITLNE